MSYRLFPPLRRRDAWAAVGTALLAAGCLAKDNAPARHVQATPATRPAGTSAPATQQVDVPLATGRRIDPSVAASSQGVGSLPVNLLLSPDGKYAVSTGAGSREQLCSTRLADGTQAGKLEFRSTVADKANGLYYGLAFGPDGEVYAAQGAAARVAVVKLHADGTLSREREIDTGKNDFPAGLALDRKGRLYVAHNDPPHTKAVPFGTPASVSVHDAATGKERGRYTFKDEVGLSNFPLSVAVNADGSKLFVGSERDDAVYVLDARDPADIKHHATIHTGSHPVGLLLDKAHGRLFVANAHSDTVSVVDTNTDKILHTILLRPQVAKDLAGATPLGLALSPDEKRLYVALGDMNAVAVVDLAEADGPELEGYIPVGWYPTAVAVAPDGKTLLVTNAKGDLARVPHDFESAKKKGVASPLTLYEGTLWRVAIPTSGELKQLTERALENSRLTPKYLGAENPLKGIGLQAGGVKHVIYVVKENRTYDHVLGDLPQGNGDPERCIFPRAVTPNQHALAERFVLLDNFYDSGEVSGDGWTWSTQAQANEYTIRNVPYQYSGRGRVFDYEGQVNGYPAGGFPANGPDGKPLSDDPRFKAGGKAVPDVAASPGGHLWDLARKQGLTIRNYGFFANNGIKDGGKVLIPDNYPAAAGLQPGGHDLGGLTDVDFRRFDVNFPDSDASADFAQRFKDDGYRWPMKAFGKDKLPSRVAEWKREFAMMLAKDPAGGAVPNLMFVRLPSDHTAGANPGHPTPRCMVADNDYGLGQLVEAVSRSPIWKSCAIVVIEDDAQNGPDHVDAHRSTCFVISPWMKKGSHDRTFQNTVSAIKTIECLLGLPPMCQYDAASGVVGGWDDAPRNDEPFVAIAPDPTIMRERNGEKNEAAPISPEQPNDPKVGPKVEPKMEPKQEPKVVDPQPATRPAAGPSTSPSTGPAAAAEPDPRLAADRSMTSAADLAAASLDMDFTRADRAPADLLNRVLWKSVKGIDAEPPPTPRVISVGGKPKDDDDD
jgi:YVTN family beta-propeller protein